MSLAAVVIATARRIHLLPRVIASIQQCAERIVVGDFTPGAAPDGDYRYVGVPPVTQTTLDALMRRDVGYLVTEAPAVVFLSDDHLLAPNFMEGYAHWHRRDDWDFLRPSRYTIRGQTIIPLNNGDDQYGSYVGGHAGVYRRVCAKALPWMAGPHHRNWDLIHSQALVQMGLRLGVAGDELAIEDIEPGARPWE